MRETKLGEKLLPLVQLLPAAAVAAAVLLTLPVTQPVLAAVPERLTPAEVEVSAPAASEAPAEEEETDTRPTLPYADGVYTGSSRGYGGKVQVQVTMEGGHITDLQILDASHETSNFLRRAKRLLSTVVEEQTWEVDAVSEATYTSRGILGAVKNALTGEVVNNPLPPQPKPAAPLVEETFTAPSAYRDGVYTASADGFGGPITVQVTVQNDTITDIQVLDHAGETSSYYYKARGVIASMLEGNTPQVDAVSGATYSSTGIINAVKLALNKAATEPEETELPAESEQPAESVPAEEVPETPVEEQSAESVAASQPEESSDRLTQWVQKVWDRLFPEEEADSTSASDVVFRAEPAAPSEDGSASEAASQPAEEAASVPEAAAEPTPETEGGSAE